MICAVGQELRDYPTLADAVRGLDVDVVIAAASPWSKRADTSSGLDVPPNVTVSGFNLFDLRQLYADAAFVVVPLQETDFQAGITTILEGMAMGRAVVCTRTTGQIDTIVDGETGIYVPPADEQALRSAIERLLADPDEAARLGAAGSAVGPPARRHRHVRQPAGGAHSSQLTGRAGTPATTVSAGTERHLRGLVDKLTRSIPGLVEAALEGGGCRGATRPGEEAVDLGAVRLISPSGRGESQIENLRAQMAIRERPRPDRPGRRQHR